MNITQPAVRRLPSPSANCRIPWTCPAHPPVRTALRTLEVLMRKVTSGLFHSVDGVVSEPNLWQFDSFDDDLGKGLAGVMERVDTVVLGRVSYQEWAGYWPTASADQEFAAFINTVEKFVASRTLKEPLEWRNSHLIEGPL